MSNKNKNELILNKLKEFLGFKTNIEFAKFLGIAPTTLSSWYARGTIDYNLIYAKCEYIDANWLLTGQGDMLRVPAVQQQGQPPPKNEVKKEATAPPACALCAEKERVIATQQQLIVDKDKIIALLETQLKECRESKAKRGASVASDNAPTVKLENV